VTSLVYELPVGKGRKVASGMPAAAAVLGGWEVSIIVRLQSGLPVQPDAPNQLALTASRRSGQIAFRARSEYRTEIPIAGSIQRHSQPRRRTPSAMRRVT